MSVSLASHDVSLPDGAGSAGANPSFGLIGMRVVMLAITAFFVALLVAYFLARLGQNPNLTSGAALARLELPIWFWFSTLVVLVSSLSLHGAGRFAALDNPRLARRAYLATTGLGYCFLLLQIPGVTELYLRHRVLVDQHIGVYGIVFLLFGLHAMHLLGGLVPLTRAAMTLSKHPLDRNRRVDREPLTWYWHYLALLWFVLWNVLLLVG